MKDPLAVEMGRRGGKKGGPSRARKLSPWDRTRIARRAANARWGNATTSVNGSFSSITLMADPANRGGWDVQLMLWFASTSDPEVEEGIWAHGATVQEALGAAVIKLDQHIREDRPFRGAES